MASEVPQQLIYFVSGMWCSTCAKNIRESVAQINGVASANINYASKLLVVKSNSLEPTSLLDQSIQARISRIGFGIKRQQEGWVLNFHEGLKKESNRKIPWTQVSLVWFLAMWSSMLAFAGYLGGDLTQQDLYRLSLASSVFGLPAILIGIFPYANSGIRALWFSKLLTLDLFIFIGGCSAIGISIFSLLINSNITYADSGSMIVAILLLTKKIENTIVTSVTSNILFQLHPKKNSVKVSRNGWRKNEWKLADISQIKKGDLVKVLPNETVPFDGILNSKNAKINNHLMSGEACPIPLNKGDDIFAGSIAEDELEILVSAPQGQRKIDAWAEAALLSGSNKSEGNKSKYTKLFSKIESSLVVFAFSGALLIAGIQALKGSEERLIIESFFVGILIFCPCLFASIIPLTKQLVHLALLKSGILLLRDDALLDLLQIRNFYFDKTGTLEAVESSFIPFKEEDETIALYLNALKEKSKHITLRNLNIHAERTSEEKTIAEITEYPGMGLVAKANDGTVIHIGRPGFFKEKGFQVSNSDSNFSLVSMNQKIVGQIIRKSIYDSESKNFLKKLLSYMPQSKIEILSGDPKVGAGKDFTEMDERISYLGNLSPNEKADLVREFSAFIGDGLNDTLALAKARVSFHLGHRIQGFAPVDFHLQMPNLNLILTALRYSKKYKKVLIQTGCAAFLYNVIALTLAAFGKFSPLGAVLSMLVSFSLMLFSVFRLNKVEGVI